MAKLTPKQARFCEEYLVDLNATQAAIPVSQGRPSGSQRRFVPVPEERGQH